MLPATTTIDSLGHHAKLCGGSIVSGGGDAWFAGPGPGKPGWWIARTNGNQDGRFSGSR